jgi:hypothetical protein
MVLKDEHIGKAARDGFIAAQDQDERSRFEPWDSLGTYMKKAWIRAGSAAIAKAASLSPGSPVVNQPSNAESVVP